jgi:hypothetical protein
VELRDAAGHAQRATIEVPATAGTTTTIPVTLSAPPTALVADPDVSLLARIDVKP